MKYQERIINGKVIFLYIFFRFLFNHMSIEVILLGTVFWFNSKWYCQNVIL